MRSIFVRVEPTVRLVTDADGVAMLVPVIDSSVREAEVSNIH
jgi:hypothetical protein